MNPQQPYQALPPVPAPGQPNLPPLPPNGPMDPYGFIVDPPKKPKLKGVGISSNPFIVKIVFILGGVVVLMIVAAIAINIFFGSKTNIQDIVDITAVEQEIIRVGAQGATASSESVKDAAINTQASLVTEQQNWIKFLAKRSHKVESKQLVVKKNLDTDKRLTQAQQTSTFDITFTQIMRSQLEAYSTQLKNAYTNATNTEEKKLLASNYHDVQLLLEQWPKNPTP
ncbi:MAG TPA: hypothetical protein VLH86_01205 [Patescibacteria group bacterium]|nr:hypothetical protein [Patescibacteria group bacterium]